MNHNTKRLLGKSRQSVITKSEHHNMPPNKFDYTVRTKVGPVDNLGQNVDSASLRRAHHKGMWNRKTK